MGRFVLPRRVGRQTLLFLSCLCSWWHVRYGQLHSLLSPYTPPLCFESTRLSALHPLDHDRTICAVLNAIRSGTESLGTATSVTSAVVACRRRCTSNRLDFPRCTPLDHDRTICAVLKCHPLGNGELGDRHVRHVRRGGLPSPSFSSTRLSRCIRWIIIAPLVRSLIQLFR